MFDVDVWQEIFSTIKKNKLRTFLTGFSVAWGIFMLMVLLGSGNGLQNAAIESYSVASQNLIWLNPGETSIPYHGLKEGQPVKFRNDDYSYLNEKAENIDLVSSHFRLPGNIIYTYKNETGSFSIGSCHPTIEYIERQKVISGRFINDLDIKDFRKVIAIGEGIRDALFKSEDPIGKWLKINNIPFLVVGVFKSNARNNSGAPQDRTSYIPVSTAQRIFSGADRVHSITVTTKMVNTIEEAEAIKDKLRQEMASRHNFDPMDKKALGTFDRLSDYLRTMKIFQAIKIFIWIIGIGTLIAGIVGVGNIMLILVKERTREIGIRKALGASPSSVIGLILLESTLITTVAGYTGLVMGTGIMEAINYGLEKMVASGGGNGIFFRNPTVDITTALTSTLILIVSGAIAGYLPARKASAVKPIEALRDE